MPDFKNGVAALAEQAANVPEERRRELETKLPFASDRRFDAGIVAGLESALAIVKSTPPETVAGVLEEFLAVAAARTAYYQQVMDEMREYALSPAGRAELDAEIARIESGCPLFPVEDVLREIEAREREKAGNFGKGDGKRNREIG